MNVHLPRVFRFKSEVFWRFAWTGEMVWVWPCKSWIWWLGWLPIHAYKYSFVHRKSSRFRAMIRVIWLVDWWVQKRGWKGTTFNCHVETPLPHSCLWSDSSVRPRSWRQLDTASLYIRYAQVAQKFLFIRRSIEVFRESKSPGPATKAEWRQSTRREDKFYHRFHPIVIYPNSIHFRRLRAM
jgi:hypothetical protein